MVGHFNRTQSPSGCWSLLSTPLSKGTARFGMQGLENIAINDQLHAQKVFKLWYFTFINS